jgi:hypothetical protein
MISIDFGTKSIVIVVWYNGKMRVLYELKGVAKTHHTRSFMPTAVQYPLQQTNAPITQGREQRYMLVRGAEAHTLFGWELVSEEDCVVSPVHEWQYGKIFNPKGILEPRHANLMREKMTQMEMRDRRWAELIRARANQPVIGNICAERCASATSPFTQLI